MDKKFLVKDGDIIPVSLQMEGDIQAGVLPVWKSDIAPFVLGGVVWLDGQTEYFEGGSVFTSFKDAKDAAFFERCVAFVKDERNAVEIAQVLRNLSKKKQGAFKALHALIARIK